MRRRPPWYLPLVTFALVASCSDLPSPSAVSRDGPRLVPQLALIPSAADATALPINRIEASTVRASDRVLLDETTFDVSPTEAEWAIEIRLPRQNAEVAVVVYISLINVDAQGVEVVQFSGFTDPIVLLPGQQAVPDVSLVRGSLDHLFTTGVSITAAPASLIEGASASVSANLSTTATPPPAVFWTSLDESVLLADDSTVTGLVPGSTLLVASSGAFSDTVAVAVLPTDQIPPTVVSTVPADGATGVIRLPVIMVRFDEEIDASSLSGSIVLRDSLSTQIPGAVTYADSVASFTPAVPLDSLHSYSVQVTTGVRDLAGNALAAPVSWGFRTEAGPAVLRSVVHGLGSLVAIAHDDRSGNLFVYDDFTAVIHEVTPDGTLVSPDIPHPGISSNDIDLDFLPVTANIGGVTVSANTLLVYDGETLVGELFAIDKDDGTLLSAVTTQSGGQTVGGAYHPGTGTFFAVNWVTDRIVEIDPVSGDSIASFPVAPTGSPTFGVFFGDVDVDPVSGNLIIVSSTQPTVRILTSAGVFVRDVSLAGLGVSSMSGVAWDAGSGTLWLTTQSGPIFQIGGVPVG